MPPLPAVRVVLENPGAGLLRLYKAQAGGRENHSTPLRLRMSIKVTNRVVLKK